MWQMTRGLQEEAVMTYYHYLISGAGLHLLDTHQIEEEKITTLGLAYIIDAVWSE